MRELAADSYVNYKLNNSPKTHSSRSLVNH